MPFTPQEVLTRIKTHVQRHVKFSTTFKYHLRSQSSEPSAQALRGNLVLQRFISLLDSILLQRRKLFFFFLGGGGGGGCFPAPPPPPPPPPPPRVGACSPEFGSTTFEKNCKITREKNSSRNLMPPFSYFAI